MTTLVATTPARITTAKGNHTGTIASCCAFQAEMQGAWASIQIDDMDHGVDHGVDDIDFDADALDATIDQVIVAITGAITEAAALQA